MTLKLFVSGIALIMFGMSFFTASDASAQVPRMNKEELKDMLGKPDVIIIDVRLKEQWDSSNVKIVGAQREHKSRLLSVEVSERQNHCLILNLT
jgi:hypothetical protein